ncbi:MAG: gliding motility-associated C-terminal domain-containing protein [Flavobacteriales bacterium]|nr:gliding motility-associated C-terminal domain-containing protein [Flavobacteriales bacterium]
MAMLAGAADPFSEVLAQPYWVQDVGGVGNEHVADVKVDLDGSVYVVGEFGGTIQFGGQSYVSIGGIDAFAARLSPTGAVLWFKQGGGSSIDRGRKLALGAAGTLAVAGEFMGQADLFGTALTSAGGTADMFVALLDKTTGDPIWIRQGGGATGTDSPGGVSVGADGRVTVAGEFRGTAQWEGSSLTSMIDPGTSQPGADIFIATYSPAGALLWLKHGSAPANDHVVEVVHDAGGNILVTGQFSHDITFGQTYANPMINASFLLRLDAAGNDVWFRRFGGGVFNHVRDMTIGPGGEILLTGDLQGQMTYVGPPSVNVAATQTYAYYLLSVNSSGQLASHSTMGSAEGVTVRGIAVRASTVAVVGEFDCQFTGLSALYNGAGLFMATGTEDLFVSMHALGSLALTEAQQFGGRSAKAAGAIAFMPEGNAVFCGSFQQTLVFPAVPGFTADVATFGGGLVGTGNGALCGDQDYGAFAASVGAGGMDGFVARGYVQGRQPYDWWIREGGACDRPALEPCIRAVTSTVCQDTISVCQGTTLGVLLKFPHVTNPIPHFVGPPVQYLWSTGSTGTNILVTTSGTYSVTITSLNGCWQWTDTIVVQVDPLPPFPLIHDDIVLNSGTPAPEMIHLCDPQTQWVWGTNMPPGTTFWWTTPFGGGAQIFNDSIQVDTTGVYTFHVMNEFGCVRLVPVMVVDDPILPMPSIEVLIDIVFEQDTDQNDTLFVCVNEAVGYAYVPTWIVDGEVVEELPPGLHIHWGVAPDPPTQVADSGPQQSAFVPQGTGWYALEIIVMVDNSPCGEDTLYFSAIDSIYVVVHPPLAIQVDLSGPSVVCDGDTITVVANCTGCGELTWQGPAFEPIDGLTVQIWSAGMFIVTAQVEDGFGCVYSDMDTVVVQQPMGPVLLIDPPDGIICPGETATIFTSVQGADHLWFGPQGPIFGQGPSLTTDVAGSYSLAMIVQGCPVTSNSVLLSNYGTPFIDIAVPPVMCFPGDAVTIQVVTAPGSVIQWLAPLFGSSPSQVVTSPGIYACSVSACGITTQLSVEVVLAPAEAELLTPGPFTLCPEDSLLLQAAPGAGSYEWLPGPGAESGLWIDAAGTYQVVVSNEFGCRDTSAAIIITQVAFPEPLIAWGDTVCQGDMAVFTATGSGTMVWYADAAFTQWLGTGGTISMPGMESMVIHVQQEQDGCVGGSQAVTLLVTPRPEAPILAGPTSVCLGDPFLLTLLESDTLTYLWSTPTGPVQGDAIDIPSVTVHDAGLYACVALYQGCAGPSAEHTLVVFVPMDPSLPEEVMLCTGGAVTFNLPGGFSSILWSNGSTSPSVVVTTGMALSVTAHDPNGCAMEAMVLVVEEDCEITIPNVFSPNGDGINDTWFPSGGFVKAMTEIRSRWGNLVYEGDMLVKPWDGRHFRNSTPCADGVYYYVIDLMRSDGSVISRAGYFHLQ